VILEPSFLVSSLVLSPNPNRIPRKAQVQLFGPCGTTASCFFGPYAFADESRYMSLLPTTPLTASSARSPSEVSLALYRKSNSSK